MRQNRQLKMKFCMKKRHRVLTLTCSNITLRIGNLSRSLKIHVALVKLILRGEHQNTEAKVMKGALITILPNRPPKASLSRRCHVSLQSASTPSSKIRFRLTTLLDTQAKIKGHQAKLSQLLQLQAKYTMLTLEPAATLSVA